MVHMCDATADVGFCMWLLHTLQVHDMSRAYNVSCVLPASHASKVAANQQVHGHNDTAR